MRQGAGLGGRWLRKAWSSLWISSRVFRGAEGRPAVKCSACLHQAWGHTPLSFSHWNCLSSGRPPQPPSLPVGEMVGKKREGGCVRKPLHRWRGRREETEKAVPPPSAKRPSRDGEKVTSFLRFRLWWKTPVTFLFFHTILSYLRIIPFWESLTLEKGVKVRKEPHYFLIPLREMEMSTYFPVGKNSVQYIKVADFLRNPRENAQRLLALPGAPLVRPREAYNQHRQLQVFSRSPRLSVEAA